MRLGSESTAGQCRNAGADQCRSVGHDPDHRVSGWKVRFVEGGRDARDDTHHYLLDGITLGSTRGGCDLGDHRFGVGRLHGDNHERGVLHRLRHRRDPNRVGLRQVVGPLGDLLRQHQVPRRTPGPNQPGEQCLAHVAATDDRDSGHAGKPYRPGTSASCRDCTMMRPALSTTV